MFPQKTLRRISGVALLVVVVSVIGHWSYYLQHSATPLTSSIKKESPRSSSTRTEFPDIFNTTKNEVIQQHDLQRTQQPSTSYKDGVDPPKSCTTETRLVNGMEFNKQWPGYMDTDKVWSLPQAQIDENSGAFFWHPANFSQLCSAQRNLGASLYAPPRYHSNNRPTGLHMVMIGDSLMRYHFVMLIHYLHTGHWIHDSMQPNLLRESSLGGEGGWPAFYRAMERYFGHDSLVCDSYRGTNRRLTMFENQYYFDQDCLANTVSFFAKCGTFGFRGYHTAADINRWSHSPDRNGTKLILDESVYEQGNFTWSFSEYEPFLRNVVAMLEPRPRVVIINEGLWPGAPENLSNELLVRQIRDTIHELGMVSIYKTTTKTTRKNRVPGVTGHDELCCQIFDHCVRMDWTACVPKTEYLDRVHFKAYPNLRFNEQLLDLLERIDIIPRTVW